MTSAITAKVMRLRQGAPPRVLDLFSGCGGLSLGFHTAGCRIEASVELDRIAAGSHARNFHNGDAIRAAARDITRTEPQDLCDELGLGDASRAFDIVVGGPPCQAYARVGRAKLREVAAHPSAFKIDARANLYLRYLRYIEQTRPLALLMENVPDIMNFGGHNIAEETAETLEAMGYVAGYTLMNAAFYGVPQFRDRVFLLAYRRELDLQVCFPQPSHFAELPTGYAGTRAVALKHVVRDSHYHPEQRPPATRPPAITTSEALADLPSITAHLDGSLRRGVRRFTDLARYLRRTRLSAYAELMRCWPGFGSTEGVYDHVIRSLPRDTFIFRAMKHGDEYPAARDVAERLFTAEVRRRERRRGGRLSTRSLAMLRKAMVPPYPTHSFPNRWWKLRPDQPSRTLLAHIGKDTYSHIHYDSEQARTISVREAARLQSFPDGFVFSGAMNAAFRQIGNAVPPLMAQAIALRMLKDLRRSLRAPRSKRAA